MKTTVFALVILMNSCNNNTQGIDCLRTEFFESKLKMHGYFDEKQLDQIWRESKKFPEIKTWFTNEIFSALVEWEIQNNPNELKWWLRSNVEGRDPSFLFLSVKGVLVSSGCQCPDIARKLMLCNVYWASGTFDVNDFSISKWPEGKEKECFVNIINFRLYRGKAIDEVFRQLTTGVDLCDLEIPEPPRPYEKPETIEKIFSDIEMAKMKKFLGVDRE